MKPLASLILGLGLAVVLFVGGIAAMTWLFSEGRPHEFANLDEKPLWTNRPVHVDPGAQSFERIAAAPVPPVFQAMAVDIPEHMEAQLRRASAGRSQEPGIDETTTGAVGSYAITDLESTPHAEWCLQKYRSYRIENNSYRSYSGETRQCESPYMDQVSAESGFEDLAGSGMSSQDAVYAPTQAGPGYDGAARGNAHIEWCLHRYGSYRSADNTYQPYHGPRRACQSPFG